VSFVSPELKSLSRSRPAGVILRLVAAPSGLCNGYRSIGKNETPCYVIEVRTIMSVLLINYAVYRPPRRRPRGVREAALSPPRWPARRRHGSRRRPRERAHALVCFSSVGRDTGLLTRAIGSAGERLVHTEEVTGSIPVSPTQVSGLIARAKPTLQRSVQHEVQQQPRPGADGATDREFLVTSRPLAAERFTELLQRCTHSSCSSGVPAGAGVPSSSSATRWSSM
jgi:hypothetical protein